MNFNEVFQSIEQGIRDVYDSDKYQSYLETMAHFHSYSLNNCMLIFTQCPDATLVAGYQTWKKRFHRQVRRGEKGIRILAPIKKNSKQDASEEEDSVHFRTISVFDVGQTEGEALPTYMNNMLHGTVTDYQQFFNQLKLISPAPIILTDLKNKVHGCYYPNENIIEIQAGMPQLQTIKTLVHEIAHACLHNREDNGVSLSREQKEIEAESVAYIICRYFGLDTGEYSFGYLAGYSSSRELPELRASMERIRHTSDVMIKTLEILRFPERVSGPLPMSTETEIRDIIGS